MSTSFLQRSCTVAAFKLSEGASSVAVECNRVTSLDVAAIQILVAFYDTLATRGGTFDDFGALRGSSGDHPFGGS